MKITLVVPFIDAWDVTKRCIEKVVVNTTEPIQLVLISNGSEHDYGKELDKLLRKNKRIKCHYQHNNDNQGVLATFKQGYSLATGDVICFIHNDVLIQEKGWDVKVWQAFEQHPQLGLAGLFGAVGVGNNGGRVRSQSKMLGVEWGKCDCHDVAWKHHSEYIDGLSPATILDGVGMFFTRDALKALTETDMFDDWRAPHHFYDRIMPLKLIDKGFKVASLGIGFDHWSGATANSSQTYNDLALKWAQDNGAYVDWLNPDQMVYNAAEVQFFEEFGHRIPCSVDSNWNYLWAGVA